GALLPFIRDEVAYQRHLARAAYGIPPQPPAMPAAVALTAKQVPVRLAKRLKFRWNAVPDAVRYEVLVRRAKHGKDFRPAGGTWRVHKTTTKTQRRLKIPSGATWTVAVRAVNVHGQRSGTTILGTT